MSRYEYMDMLDKYKDTEVMFSHYYKNTFYFKAELADGSILMASDEAEYRSEYTRKELCEPIKLGYLYPDNVWIESIKTDTEPWESRV